MMKSLCLFAVLICTASAAFDQLKLETCGGDGSVVVNSVDVNPMPITFPGKLNVALDASLNRDLQGPIGVKLRIYTKTRWLGWIKFPLCVKRIGSCDYMDICDILEDLGEKGCPRDELAELGVIIPRCHCPLPAASVKLAFNDLELPSLPSALSMFTKGDYKVEGRVFEKGKEVSCFRVYASLG